MSPEEIILNQQAWINAYRIERAALMNDLGTMQERLAKSREILQRVVERYPLEIAVRFLRETP